MGMKIVNLLLTCLVVHQTEPAPMLHGTQDSHSKNEGQMGPRGRFHCYIREMFSSCQPVAQAGQVTGQINLGLWPLS